jgi:hypothetical protein
MAKKLSSPRRNLLECLSAAGGALPGRTLSIPERCLASRMNLDRLVLWDPPPDGRTNNLDMWELRITTTGEEALRETARSTEGKAE